MEKEKLRNVISILYDMELNDYCMTKSIEDLDGKINSLGISYYYKVPVKEEVEFLTIMGSTIFLGFIAGCVMAFLSLWDYFTWETILAWIIGCTVLGFVVGIIWSIREVFEKKKRYKFEMENYNCCLQTDRNRVAKELYEQKILFDKRTLLANQKQNSLLKLQQFKVQSGIDKKFCNIVALGYMNEFIKLGISTKLDGADGLYYLIMQELRWDQMQLTMEEISAKLDTVIDNQRMLHMDLMEMNRQSNIMIGELVNGVQNLNCNVNELKSIEAYNGTRIRKELEFQNFMLMCNS